MAIIHTTLIVLLCFFDFVRKTDTTSTAEQHSLTVDKGGTLVLNCSRISPHSSQWKHIPYGNKNPINVSVDGKLSTKYESFGRFSLNIESERGAFDLSIKDVAVIDRGVYLCYGDNVELARFTVSVNNQQRNLTVAPINTIVLIGDRARLNCTTSYHESQVYWAHLPLVSGTSRNVYLGIDGLQGLYSSPGRYSIQGNHSIGQYDLVIDDVSISDAGTYRCIDKSGLGKKSSADLIVLVSVPECTSNVSSDGVIFEPRCGMEPSYIEFSCSVSYHGFIEPTLVWSQLYGEISQNDTRSLSKVGPISKETTAHLVVRAENWMMSQQAACRVKELDLTQQFHECPRLTAVDLDTKNLKKSSSSFDESPLECSSMLLGFCQYIWKDGNGKVIGHGWTSPSSGLRSGGNVTCDCDVPATNCSFKLLVVTIEEYKGSEISLGIVMAIIVAAIIFTTIFLIVITLWIKCTSGKAKKYPSQEVTNNSRQSSKEQVLQKSESGGSGSGGSGSADSGFEESGERLLQTQGSTNESTEYDIILGQMRSETDANAQKLQPCDTMKSIV